MLTKEQIFQTNDIRTKTIKIPEWNGEIAITMLTGAERDWLENITFPLDGRKTTRENIRATWAVFSLSGNDGKRLYPDVDILSDEKKSNLEKSRASARILIDINKLGTKSAAALDRIFTAALSLNKVTNKDIEEMAKNSEATPAENSITN